MTVRVSLAVMAHPKRKRFVDELVPTLDREPEVVWDRNNDRWDTGRRSLLAYDRAATHHLVVQDDAIVSRDLVAATERAAAVAGERPMALYIGRGRPYRGLVSQANLGAERAGATWIEMHGPWWGVAIVLPTVHIPEVVKWGDGRPDVANYDKRISRWYGQEGIRCWYTVPSLVDHRRVAENPSLIPGRSGNRYAHTFIGQDRSGLEVEWQSEPFVPPEKYELDREARKEIERARNRERANSRRKAHEELRKKQAQARAARRATRKTAKSGG